MDHSGIFSADFVNEPYWWQAFRPGDERGEDLPSKSEVVIVGGGFTGLSMALALRRLGKEVTVLEAKELGHGASTRNGGGVSGGVNIGKRLSGRKIEYAPAQQTRFLNDAARAYQFLESFIADEKIECHWNRTGRFVGAWTPAHYAAQAKTVEALNRAAESGSYMVPREKQREEIATDLYFGGQIIERSAFIHPALLYRGFLQACRREGVRLCDHTEVQKIEKNGEHWRVSTSQGELQAVQVAIASNGYTGKVTQQFRKRIVPIASHIIVTEPLPEGLMKKILPTNRMINDTLRIRSYYRSTPDGTRLLFGGRGRFGNAKVRENSAVLYKAMVQRLPDMAGIRLSHGWSGNVAFTFDGTPHMGQQDGLFYAMGCNGSGVAMLSYLGYQTARKIAGVPDFECAFEGAMPANPLYTGRPWFLPAIGTAFRMRDKWDRARAER